MTTNLSHFVTAVALLHPDRPALTELHPLETRIARQLSYSELDVALDRVAAAAARAGLASGDRVGIALGNSIDFLLWTYGLARAGVVSVIMNPRLRSDDFSYVLAQSGAVGIVADDIAAPTLLLVPEATEMGLKVAARGASIAGFEDAETFLSRGKTVPHFAVQADSPAFIHYTSGSTGRPKGVITTHQGIADHYRDLQPLILSMHNKPVVNLVCSPLFHTSGTQNALISFVAMGGMIIMPSFDAATVLRAIADHEVTTATLVATMLLAMLAERDLRASLNLSSLQSIMSGSAPTGAAVLDEVAREFGAPVYQIYGSTEGGWVFCHVPGRPYTLESCGRPTPNMECRLIDEDGEESDEGELWIRNRGWSTGYVAQPDETAKKFRGDWYLSGDIMRRDENGYYFFRGRTDDMFVCGGENIYPAEVERVLLQHPQVRNVCVAPIAHATKVAVPSAMVERHDESLDEAALKAFALANAPAYAHPRIVRFVDALPVAVTGKVDRKAVRATMQAEAEAAMQGGEQGRRSNEHASA
jgi:acyl-CoA synthetase (AMP-forming)/AMP-acid ligase II